MSDQPTTILGAGSIGLLLAAHLAPARVIQRAGAAPLDGVLLHQGEQRHRVAVQGLAAGQLEAAPDWLIVCTKAYDALPALRGLGAMIGPGTRLLLMQNGMGSQQAVAEAYPQLSVYAASSTEGAWRPAPGEVVHAGRGLTRIGRLQGEPADWVGRFRAGGLAAEPAEPIEWHLADKLRVNALINPLTVLHGCRNGELLEDPAVVARMRRLGAEADAVLAAAGWRYPRSAYEQAAAVARATAANWSSMYQDAAAGRRLELDYINGYLQRLGERLGVATPEHAAVVERLRSAER